MSTRNLAFLGCALVSALGGGGGCGKTYVVAHARMAEVEGRATPRDVRRTANYMNIANSVRSVAFRAPDTCFSQTAGRATGTVASSGSILTTECAVWLAELERAVTLQGYRVISWDVLLRAERTGGGSIYDVAKRLGADLVFILNSLETQLAQGGRDMSLSISYHQSDPRGDVVRDYLLNDDQRRILGNFINEKLQLQQKQEAMRSLQVMLDTTAILASTGEAVWYYRWGVNQLIGAQKGADFLFRGRDLFWRPVLPLGVEPQHRMQAAGTMSSQYVIVSSAAARPEDAQQQAMFALVQSVAKDFVQNFRVGGGQ